MAELRVVEGSTKMLDLVVDLVEKPWKSLDIPGTKHHRRQSVAKKPIHSNPSTPVLAQIFEVIRLADVRVQDRVDVVSRLIAPSAVVRNRPHPVASKLVQE